MGPLEGIKVIDMTSVLMGPFATQTLGDYGADVIKVETPDGDVTRQIGPTRHPGMGPVFLNTNRSKRSICLDLKKPAGRDAVLRLIATADVLVYNVRPQAMARLQLGYDVVSKVNPRLIYAGVFGFGQDGPYAAKPAYDDLIQGATALPALMAQTSDGVPRYVPNALVDRIVGLTAVGAICASLVHRDRTGRGQRVDIPMFETMAGFVMGDHMGGLTYEPPLDKGGYARHLSRDRRPYKTSDGYICVIVYNDKQWENFFAATGRDDLRRDPKFATFAGRAVNIDTVYAELARILETRTTAEWTDLLVKADVPVMPMHDLESMLQDPHLVATDFFPVVDHPTEGKIRNMKVSATWSDTPVETGSGWRRVSMNTARKFSGMPATPPTRSPRWFATASPSPRPPRGVETMDFALTANQESIRDAIGKICTRFDDAYWLKKDKEGGYPADFHRALADAGWLGICIPEEYGGSGLGITDAAIMMRTISESGAGMSGASAVHMNVFGLNPVVVFGTDEQRRRMLPGIVDGRDKSCFAVTEPNTGLNTTQLKTRAVRSGDKYIVNGQKVWISTAQVASKILLLARTTPLEEVKSPTHGLSLFYTDFDKKRVAVHEIEKLGRKAVDSNELFFENFEIPVEDRIGEEGRGFEYILHGMNPERILIAAEAVGLGKIALKRATDYAKSRIVFNRPIGKNQAIQHPLAKNWMELEAAWLMVMSAGWQYDQGLPCGPAANAAKYLAGRSRLPGLRAGGDDAWRFWLCQGISCRALPAGIADPAHRPDQPAAHSQLHCREGAGPAEIVLR